MKGKQSGWSVVVNYLGIGVLSFEYSVGSGSATVEAGLEDSKEEIDCDK